MTLAKIWVLAEPAGSTISAASLELISTAAKLAGEVVAYTWSVPSSEFVDMASKYGADSVVGISDTGNRLAGTTVGAVMASEIQGGAAPSAIFFAASYEGRDAAGRLSAKIDAPVLTNVVNLLLEGSDLLSEHAIFGGSEIVSARFTSEVPGIFVIRAKSFVAEQNPKTPTLITREAGDIGAAGRAKLLESHVEERTGPKLDEAAIVVSGGRGLGKAESYTMVEDLASLLNGAPGASRAIVDAGWVPYSYQVGQTGKTVKPTVYIACGISGATQHMVGMKGAKNIIAVNKDQEAPIFSISDLGIVGDVHKVLPALIEALRAR